MILGTITKQPAEILDYDLQFDSWLAEGDKVVSAVAVLADAGTVQIEVEAFDEMVKLWISGGIDGQEGLIEVTATTDGGRIKQDEINLRVVEVN